MQAGRVGWAKAALQTGRVLALAGGLVAACGGEAGEERRGWYGACRQDADCGEGRCVCGICSVQCAATCESGPPGSSCLGDGHWAHELLCAGRPVAALCVAECDDAGACGLGLACVDGVCLPTDAVERAREHGVEIGRVVGGACGADGVLRHSAVVSDQESVDALGGCTRIDGDLLLSVFAGIDPEPLRSLRAVSGVVTVAQAGYDAGLSELPNPLAGLESLEEVGGMTLDSLRLDSLEPLARLRRVTAQDASDQRRGVLTLRLAELSSLRGLALQEVGMLELSVASLSSLEGLGSAKVERLSVSGTALSSLAGLEQVTGLRELWLGDNPLLASLEGLGDTSSLELLSIGLSAGLRSLAGLGETSALEVLEVRGASNLESLGGLSLPASMSRVTLQAVPLTHLRELQGLIEVSELALGDVAIASLEGLAALERVERLALSGNPLQTSLEGLGAPVIQDLAISSLPLADLRGLQNVTGLEQLTLTYNSSLVSLAGLGELGELRRFHSAGNTALTSLFGLEGASGLRSVLIDAEHVLSSLAGLVLPAEMDEVELLAPQLADIGALGSVQAIRTLRLEGTALVNLDALSSLRRSRRIELSHNPNLVQADALRLLEVVNPHLTITSNPALASLPVFASVGGGAGSLPDVTESQILIWGNDALGVGPEFPGLEQVGYLSVSYNPLLSEIAGFARLLAAREVRIESNETLGLLDLGALETVTSSLQITGNPQLGGNQLERLRQLPIEGEKRIDGN